MLWFGELERLVFTDTTSNEGRSDRRLADASTGCWPFAAIGVDGVTMTTATTPLAMATGNNDSFTRASYPPQRLGRPPG
jgi:hypothetical protein